MLEAIVGKEDRAFRMRGQQPARGGDPVASDPHRHAERGQDERLVADDPRIGILPYRQRDAGGTPIATTHDARPMAARREMLRERGDQRRLAGATDGHVADHDDRHRQPLRGQHADAVQPAPSHDDQPVQQRQWPQQRCKEGQARRIPGRDHAVGGA